MTVLTTNLIIKKAPLHSNRHCEEGVVQIFSNRKRSPRNRSIGALVCLSVLALGVATAGLGTGLMVYRQYMRSNAAHHYQGYCTIPISSRKVEPQLIEQNFRVLPLRFSSEPDVKVVNLLGDDDTDDLVNTLREELDIGGSVEKISVLDNGRRVNFTHDFEANFTGIVDEERCFTMDLDPEVVAAPSVFVVGIERDDKFDVSRVRTTVRAALPPVADLSELARGITFFLDNCLHRPLYRLHKDDGIIIRKRSADEPAHDYIQFSGKHIQEIEITNLPELLQEEQNARARRSAT